MMTNNYINLLYKLSLKAIACSKKREDSLLFINYGSFYLSINRFKGVKTNRFIRQNKNILKNESKSKIAGIAVV